MQSNNQQEIVGQYGDKDYNSAAELAAILNSAEKMNKILDKIRNFVNS